MNMGIFLVIFAACLVPGDDRFRLAIVNFTDASTADTVEVYGGEGTHLKVLIENLGHVLQRDFNLVERDKVELIFKEQELVSKNKLDDETAAKLGRMTGAEYLLTGVVTERNKEVREYESYGIKGKNTICRLSSTFRILHTTTGEVFAVGEVNVEKSYRNQPNEDTIIRDLTKLISLDIGKEVNKFFKAFRDKQRSQAR